MLILAAGLSGGQPPRSMLVDREGLGELTHKGNQDCEFTRSQFSLFEKAIALVEKTLS